jgi:ADP-heptose:LPS heptosyltransferase
MGDVALVAPVIRGFIEDNPDVRITFVTRSFFTPLFSNIPGLTIISADFSGKHKGFRGLVRLYSDIKKSGNYDRIVDLHGVIRSFVLRVLFQSKGIKSYTIRKDRKIKEAHLHQDSKPKLKHSIDRYALTFMSAGYSLKPFDPPVFISDLTNQNKADGFIKTLQIESKNIIGIAPFAKHKLKMWPISKVRNLIDELEKRESVHVLLFGGGNYENEQLKLLAGRYSHCDVVNLELASEIALIKRLDCMVSMDSANMHIAALSNIPVVSIWGATHPGMGFSPWKQPEEQSVQISVDELPCRPCTIYGKGVCRRGDFACMERISFDLVLKAIDKIIQ